MRLAIRVGRTPDGMRGTILPLINSALPSTLARSSSVEAAEAVVFILPSLYSSARRAGDRNRFRGENKVRASGGRNGFPLGPGFRHPGRHHSYGSGGFRAHHAPSPVWTPGSAEGTKGKKATRPAERGKSIRGGRPGAEQVVDRQTPAGDGGLGVGRVAAAEDGGRQRVRRPVTGDRFPDRVDVPDGPGPGGEVVRPLLCVGPVGGRAVIVLAPDLDGEGRRPVDETHGVFGRWPDVVGGVGRERLSAVRQGRSDGIPDVVRERLPHPRPPLVLVQAHEYPF